MARRSTISGVGLRIIGGEYRGRVLRTREGRDTRPLLGQVREAVFNILTGRLEGAEVWDLFAGSGASGIEALSRGARRVLFVEKSNQALRVLRQNLELLGPEAKQRSHVLRVDAWDPPSMTPRGEEFEVPPDVVFLDPPYPAVAEDPVRAACRARALVDRVADDGVVCFHFREGHLQPDDFDRDLEVDMRSWGTTVFAFLSRRA